MVTDSGNTQFGVSYQSLFRVVVVAALVVALFALRGVIAALLLAVVIASGIEPGVRWLARYRLPRVLAVLVIYVIAFAVIGSVISLVIPPLVDEFRAFLDSFPRYQRILLQELRSFQNLPFYSFFSGGAEDAILNPPFDIRAVGGNTLNVLFGVVGGIFSGVILIVVSFYLASQERGIEHFLRMVTPLRDEEYVLDLWARSQAKIGQWLRGQLVLALVIGILVYVVLTVLGIRYALSLALLAAILEIVPIIGPILAAVPAVFLAFLTSPLLALIVALAYVLVQQLESHLIVPMVMQRAVGLNPLLVILALLIGGALGGILGLFLAVPVAAVIVEFLTDTDRKKRGLFQFGNPPSS